LSRIQKNFPCKIKALFQKLYAGSKEMPKEKVRKKEGLSFEKFSSAVFS